MKKVLITATLLIGMMASAMVFSSFTTPKLQNEALTSQVNAQEDWKMVGEYKGYKDGDSRPTFFKIWEKQGMCGAYYWVIDNGYANPDKASVGYSGQLRQNREKQWYASWKGDIYIIKGF